MRDLFRNGNTESKEYRHKICVRVTFARNNPRDADLLRKMRAAVRRFTDSTLRCSSCPQRAASRIGVPPFYITAAWRELCRDSSTDSDAASRANPLPHDGSESGYRSDHGLPIARAARSFLATVDSTPLRASNGCRFRSIREPPDPFILDSASRKPAAHEPHSSPRCSNMNAIRGNRTAGRASSRSEDGPDRKRVSANSPSKSRQQSSEEPTPPRRILTEARTPVRRRKGRSRSRHAGRRLLAIDSRGGREEAPRQPACLLGRGLLCRREQRKAIVT